VIIEPDFVDHWKTRMLVGLLGDDELAPVYLIRLWSHCQNRKAWVFENMPTLALKGVCHFKGDAEAFEQALVTSGFIERDGASVRVMGWDEYNASLIANWENGKKGGRPPKQKNPTETHGLTKENPNGTQEQPVGNPIREEKIGEEKTLNVSGSSKAEARASRLPNNWEATDEQLSFCRKERPDLDAFVVASRFRDYWVAVAGAKGRKLDWDATWRNWVRNEKSVQPRASPGSYAQQRDQQRDETIAILTGRRPNERTTDAIDVEARPID